MIANDAGLMDLINRIANTRGFGDLMSTWGMGGNGGWGVGQGDSAPANQQALGQSREMIMKALAAMNERLQAPAQNYYLSQWGYNGLPAMMQELQNYQFDSQRQGPSNPGPAIPATPPGQGYDPRVSPPPSMPPGWEMVAANPNTGNKTFKNPAGALFTWRPNMQTYPWDWTQTPATGGGTLTTPRLQTPAEQAADAARGQAGLDQISGAGTPAGNAPIVPAATVDPNAPAPMRGTVDWAAEQARREQRNAARAARPSKKTAIQDRFKNRPTGTAKKTNA